jgi:hypothetical protein
LYTVEDLSHQSWAQLYGQGPTQVHHWLAGTDAVRGFVGLDYGLVAAERDDLTVQTDVADAHLGPIADTGHADGDDGTVDIQDTAGGGVIGHAMTRG